MRTGERKGAIIVLVAVLMVVLLGFGAFAVDVSQMQAHKSELRRTADAAVLAATLQLLHETQFQQASIVAQQFVTVNPVMGRPAQIARLEYGRHNGVDFTSDCVDPGCTLAHLTAANAVRLSMTQSGTFYLAQRFGSSGFTLDVQSTAYLPVFATPCAGAGEQRLAPWAILKDIWDAKFVSLPSSNPQSLTTLRNWSNSDPRKLFSLKHPEDEGGPFPGREQFFGAVNLPAFPEVSPSDGVVNYVSNIGLGGLGDCHLVLPNDELQTKMGWLDAATIDGLRAFCSGLLTSNCYNAGGQRGVAVRIPIVEDLPAGSACSTTVLYSEDEYTTPSLVQIYGSVRCVRVLDIGTFVLLTGVEGINPVEHGAVGAVFAGNETVGPVRGYAQRPILVQ